MKKNVLIVTVYNSENSGSFLQAYALKVAIERMGCEVYHLKRNTHNTSHSFSSHLKYAIINLLRLRIRRAIRLIERWFIYEKHIKSFNIVKGKDLKSINVDVAVLGSDTIWNFNDSYFESQAKMFLGHGLNVPKIITYAVSVANTSFALFEKTVNDSGGIEHISDFLLRDQETQSHVSKIIDKNTEIVCDPTLLLKKEDYSSFYDEVPIEKFLLLYYYEKIDSDLQCEILSFAQKHNLKIVSLVHPYNWCDYYVNNSPSNMISYYRNAAFVITDTFHGTIFSLLFKKHFAVHNSNIKKVNHILHTVGETSRLFIDPSDIDQILSIKFSDNTAKRIEEFRTASIELLYSALNN